MPLHSQLDCLQVETDCLFCHQTLTREQLLTSHCCQEVFPKNTYVLTQDRIRLKSGESELKDHFEDTIKCFACKSLLRCPKTCKQCKFSLCEVCLLSDQKYKDSKVCPASDPSHPHPFVSSDNTRCLRNLLSLFEVECKQCGVYTPYDQVEQHDLTHIFCRYCPKKLPSWAELRTHCYKDCPRLRV
jgi:hypothetical protein